MSILKKIGCSICFIVTIMQFACVDKKMTSTKNDCKEYYTFLKENWKNEKGVYYFKGHPDYWKESIYDTYVKESCLLGKSKNEIVSILGKPSIIFQNSRINTINYCMNNLCLTSKYLGGGNCLFIEFNQKDIVIYVYTSPPKNDL